MIIFYDHNYPPLAIFEIDNFLEIDFKTFKKLFNNLLKDSTDKKQYINIYIDLYNLNEYSIYSIKDITYYLTYLDSDSLKFINKINIYIKKNDDYFINLLKNINDYSIMNIQVIETEDKQIWKKNDYLI